MILIKSLSNDYSTTHVIKYLEASGVPYFRVNEERIVSLSISAGEIQIVLSDGRTLDLSQVTGYWFRRGAWKFEPLPAPSNETSKLLRQQIAQERESLLAFLHERLLRLGKMSDEYSARQANKLKQMDLAQQLGLKVPPFLVTGNKNELIRFWGKWGPLITKVLDNPLPFLAEKVLLPSYTIALDAAEIAKLPEKFAPSLFQTMISKRLEIRVFYLGGRIWPMAIFSQLDTQTAVDFRHYNWRRPNRNVPYALPKEIEDRLHAFMKKMPFDSGSFDLILDHSGVFYFLELNPVGQFGMVSIPCNYYLENEIAQYLARNQS